MDFRKRCSPFWLACCLTICGCGGTAENSVAPLDESNVANAREALRQQFSDRQSKQEEVKKAIEAAKQQNN